MTPAEIRELADEVRRVCPKQTITDEELRRWPGLLVGIRYSEALLAVAMLRFFQRHIEPEHIAKRVQVAREKLAEPFGDAWKARVERHGGREFSGGPVCWDPVVECEGICRECPRELAGGAS